MVASALLSSVGGILLGASLGSATPDTSDSLLIPAFAAAFLGTAGFAVGRFNVPGTFVAVLIVGVAVSGLEQLGAALWVQPVFDGVVLFVAVGLTAFTTRLRAAAAHRARLREIADRIAEMEYNAEHNGNGTVVGTSGLADIQQ
jgi:ribose transport system permease protein